jgi:Zn-dependent protease with chaperone function
MSSGELYAILFHEFAHIKGLDNVIGSSLMRTRNALRAVIKIVSDFSRIVMRFTIFGLILGLLGLLLVFALWIFDVLYSVAILLYSRQREFLADYLASMYVGGDNFGTALENYSKSAENFGIKVGPIIRNYLSQKQALKNIYDATRKLNVNFDEQTKKRIEENIKRGREKTTIFSTHPAINTRLENIKNITGRISNIPKGSCAELFSDFTGKEEELTKIVYGSMPIKKPSPT